MKKNDYFSPRLLREAQETLRHKGSPHSSPKSVRGYNRQQGKISHRQDQSEQDWSFLL